MRRRAGLLAVNVDRDHVLRFGFASTINRSRSRIQASNLSPEGAPCALNPGHTLQPQMALQLVSACVRFAGFNENEEPRISRGAWLLWL